MGICLAMDSMMSMMGSFFKASRRANSSRSSFLQLLSPDTSPAYRTVNALIEKLSNEKHEGWQPLVGSGRGWSPALYTAASVPALMALGSVHKRFIMALDCWPWRLGLFSTGTLTEAGRHSLATELEEADECCLDEFTARIKDAAQGDILSRDMQQRLRTVFEAVPITNVGWMPQCSWWVVAVTSWLLVLGCTS